jgi:general secretion pathway protein B
MSLILDALKKLDREKSSRRNGAVNIAAEILRPDLPRPRKRMLVYFTALFLTAVATAAITYAVISKTPPPAGITPAAPSLQVTPESLSHKPVRNARDEIRDPTKTEAPVETKRPVESKKPTEIKKPTESKKQPAEVKTPPLSPGEEKTSPEVILKEAPVVPEDIRKPAEQTPRRSAVTPASLRLSGIVWSEDPSKRLAVINGLVTTEGYVFEGVKVVEIYPDHVLLLLNDQPFELSLNK